MYEVGRPAGHDGAEQLPPTQQQQQQQQQQPAGLREADDIEQASIEAHFVQPSRHAADRAPQESEPQQDSVVDDAPAPAPSRVDPLAGDRLTRFFDEEPEGRNSTLDRPVGFGETDYLYRSQQGQGPSGSPNSLELETK